LGCLAFFLPIMIAPKTNPTGNLTTESGTTTAPTHVADVTTLEPDENAQDDDSAFGDQSLASYTTSLKSSVLDYKYENGRRFHAFRRGEYLVPNDEQEQDRMDLLHHIYAIVLGGGLHLAPLKDPNHALDLGTGTGIWAIDFADQYPSATIIGNDLSPIQPPWTPPGVSFEVDDFEADWTYTRPFDYIHGRELVGSVKDLDRLTRQALAHLKPGGWFELQTVRPQTFSDDGSHEKAKYTLQLSSLLLEASAKFGKPLGENENWEETLKKAGFTDVVFRVIKVPMGPWPKDPKQKEIGKCFRVQFLEAISSYSVGLLPAVLGWAPEEVSVLLAQVRSESKDLSIHNYTNMYIVYGRKPESGEE